MCRRVRVSERTLCKSILLDRKKVKEREDVGLRIEEDEERRRVGTRSRENSLGQADF
jgi:hypothetical protein